MSGKNRTIFLVSILIVLALLFYYSGFLGKTIIGDDFVTRIDFDVEYPQAGDYNVLWKSFFTDILSGQKKDWEITGHPIEDLKAYPNFQHLLSGDAYSSSVNGLGGSLIVPYSNVNRGKIQIWDRKDYRGNDIKIRASGGQVYLNEYRFNMGSDGSILLAVSSTVNSDMVQVSINGADKGEINLNGKPLNIGLETGLWVDYIKYNPLGCEIRNDEVLVFDDFTSGSSFNLIDDDNIQNLKYKPIHYCPTETQFLIRDLTTNNIVGDRGELLRKLVRGETITVPQNKLYRVSYITKFVEGQTPSCSIGFAINTKTNKCEQVIFQKEPSEVILQCKTDSDCILINGCKDITFNGCKSNQCDYSSKVCSPDQIINELIVYKEILKEVQSRDIKFIPLNVHQFSFTHKYDAPSSLNIGTLVFSSSTPEYICGAINEVYSDRTSGKVSKPDCYSVTTNSGKLKNNEEININEYLKVKYLFSGAGVRFNENQLIGWQNNNDWVNVFMFTIDPSFLKINNFDVKNEYLINSNAQIKIMINNNFKEINSVKFEVKTSPRLLKQAPKIIITQSYALNYGVNEILIDVPTDQIGLINVEVIPFFEVNADNPNRFHTGESALFSYNVVSVLSPESVTMTILPTKTEDETENVSIKLISSNNWFYVIVLAIIISLLILWYFITKRM